MSVHESIANAVAAIISGLGLPNLVVEVRAVVFRSEGDSDRLCLVTMGDERTETWITGGNELRLYEIVVSVSLPSNAQLRTDIGDAKDVRQRCRKALVPDDTTPRPFMPSVASVYDVTPVDLPALPEDAHRANWQVARLGLIYRTSETIRGA